MELGSYDDNSFIGFYNLTLKIDGDNYNISQSFIGDHKPEIECSWVQIYKHRSIYSVYAPTDARGK